jgi:SSS family transporter
MQTINLHPIDIGIVVAYMAALVLIGLYHSGKQASLLDFFMAHKGMSWIPVGISLMAALNSGMDYLNTPSAVIRLGWLNILVSGSWLIIFPYMFFIVIPMFRRLDTMSVYEYIGLRFGDHMRTFTSVIFVLWRLSWMAGALYVPCLALTTAVGQKDWLVPMIITIGTIVTFYTMMGGIKAVIWNDVTQFILMMTGLVVTLVVVLSHVEGGVSVMFAEMFTEGLENKPNPNIDTSTWYGNVWSYFTIDLVIPGLILAWFVRLGGFTSDQVMIQRFSTAKSLRHARQSFLITAVSDIVWMTLLFMVGVALVIYIKGSGDLPDWVTENTDRIFPYVMAEIFPVGVTGLVLAAILAASLSSVDSAINSLTTVGMVDFYRRLYLGREDGTLEETPEEQRRQVWLSRILTVIVGAAGVTLACYVENFGTLFDVLTKVLSGFMAVMLAIFWLGMFTRRATTASTITGALVGVTVALFLGYPGLLSFGYLSEKLIGVIWVAPATLLTTLLVGVLLGTSQPDAAAQRWNWRAIMKTKLVE